MTPLVEVFESTQGKTLYRVGTSTNSKKLVFDADELCALGFLIQTVLGGTPHVGAST